jgi:cytochrome c553
MINMPVSPVFSPYVRLLLLVAAISSGVLCSAQAATVTAEVVPPAIATCFACHGAGANGSPSGVPRLAGKNAAYLAHALSMFKAGTRASPEMQFVAGSLSESEIQALSLYLAQQHPARLAGPTPNSALVEAGRTLAEKGAGGDLPACFSCHGAGGKGVGDRFPSIAGETEAFTISRLHEFQGRAKAAKAAPGSMTAVSANMNEAEIHQAAAYLSQINP